MKVRVIYWCDLRHIEGVPPPGDGEFTAEEIVALHTILDVALITPQDNRKRKQKAQNDPVFDPTVRLTLDVHGGRFRQR
jgi:hypothetical protein